MSFLSDLESIIASQDRDVTSATAFIKACGVPSASIALLSSGEIWSHVISSEPSVNRDTVFQACSISKATCATAVFRAIQAGHLSLDTPITQYLSRDQISLLTTPKTANLIQHVTLSHLLSHTSGLDVHGFPGYANQNLPSSEEILAGSKPSNTPQVRLVGLPGRRYYYSGGAYTVIELIMESILSKPFPDIMQELVFTPLEMSRSFYRPSPSENNQAIAYVTGTVAGSPSTHTFPELGAAGLWTTPTDLLRMVRALQKSAMNEDHTFLNQSAAKAMFTEIRSGMARGWMKPADGLAFSHHGSNDPGFRCHVLGFLDIDGDEKLGNAKHEGLAIMTNGALGSDLIHKIIHAVAWMRQWPCDSVAKYASIEGVVPFLSYKPIDEKWHSWRGTWIAKPGGTMKNSEFEAPLELVLYDGGPSLRFQSLPAIPLRAAAIVPRSDDGKGSIDLVVDGLDMMLRLGWADGKRSLEVWNGCWEAIEIFELLPSVNGDGSRTL